MSLLGCTQGKDSKKLWNLMTIGMEFQASSIVTNVVDGTIYTKLWNGGEVKYNDYSWTREHPTAYQIHFDAPSDYNKFWVVNRGCCCWQCRFNLTIKDQTSGGASGNLINDHRTVEWEVPWERFEDGVLQESSNERIRPLFRKNSSPLDQNQFCKNSGESGRSPQEWIASWENDNMTPWLFGGGGTQITKTQTYTGSDGKTTSGGWAGAGGGFSLTEGEYAGYNNALSMLGVCENNQITMSAKLEWDLEYQHNEFYDYDSAFSGYLMTYISLEVV